MDSSRIVKPYVDEPGSAEVRTAAAEADRVVTSLVAYAEVQAAFAAKRRSREFSARELRRLIEDFEAEWPGFLRISVSESIVYAAGSLIQNHVLGGLDAINLASAIAFREPTQDRVDFAVADRRLLTAAVAEGFVIVRRTD